LAVFPAAIRDLGFRGESTVKRTAEQTKKENYEIEGNLPVCAKDSIKF